MSRKSTRPAWLFVAVLALTVAVPGIVYAATGTFSSSSSGPALTTTNSGTGRAIDASSNTGNAGSFVRNARSGKTTALFALNASNTSGAPAIWGVAEGTGTGYQYGVYGQTGSSLGAGVFGFAAKTTGQNYGVYGRTSSVADNASGVFGGANAGSGLTNGVWGQSGSEDGTGVLGVAEGLNGFGVFGIGGLFGVIGSTAGEGGFALFSDGDIGSSGHIVSTVGQIAGTCTVVSATQTKTCTFTDPFPEGSSPIVVITPAEDPSAVVAWVSGATTTGFTINTSAAPGSDLTYNYIVVATVPVSAAQFSSATRR